MGETEGFAHLQKTSQGERSESRHTARSGKHAAYSVGQSTVSSTPPRSRYDRSMSRERVDGTFAFGHGGSRSHLRERSLPDPPRRYRQPPAELMVATDSLRKTSGSDGSDDARRSEPPVPPSPSWGRLPSTPRGVQQQKGTTVPDRCSQLRRPIDSTSSASSTTQSVHLTESSTVPGSRAASADASAGLPTARFLPAAPLPARPQSAAAPSKPRLSQLPTLSLPAPPQTMSRDTSPVPGAEQEAFHQSTIGPAKLPDLRLPPSLTVHTSGIPLEGQAAAAALEDDDTDGNDDSTDYEELASGLHVCKVPEPVEDFWFAQAAENAKTADPVEQPQESTASCRSPQLRMEGAPLKAADLTEELDDDLCQRHAAASKVQAAFRRRRRRSLQPCGRAASSWEDPWQPAEDEEVAMEAGRLGEAAEDIVIQVDCVSDGEDTDEVTEFVGSQVEPQTMSMQSVPRSEGTSGRNLSLLSALADGHNARMVKRDVEACEELDLVRVESADLDPPPQVLGHSAASDKASQDFDEGLLTDIGMKHPAVRAKPSKHKPGCCSPSCLAWLASEVGSALDDMPRWLRWLLLAMCSVVVILFIAVLLRLYT